MQLELRQSKRIFVLGVISAAIFETLFLALTIFFMIDGINKPYASDEYTVFIIISVFSAGFAIVILIILIYLIYVFIHQTDVYTDDKMFRKRRDKIIFEIPYENIIDIKQGFDSVFFILKTSIKRLDGKEAPRNFYEHYAQKDIDKIIKIISNYTYNSSIFKNGG